MNTPNKLTLARVLMVPVFVICFCIRFPAHYFVSLMIFVIASITDAIDGKLARERNQITDFGKFLDPLADKISQLILLLCLINRYPKAAVILCIFIVKEAAVISLGYIAVRMQGENEGAKWYGKLSTAVFYIVMILLILISDINISTARYLLDLCGICITAAFVGYLIHFVRIYMKYRKKE